MLLPLPDEPEITGEERRCIPLIPESPISCYFGLCRALENERSERTETADAERVPEVRRDSRQRCGVHRGSERRFDAHRRERARSDRGRRADGERYFSGCAPREHRGNRRGHRDRTDGYVVERTPAGEVTFESAPASRRDPPETRADGYRYYRLWEIYRRVAQVFRAG